MVQGAFAIDTWDHEGAEEEELVLEEGEGGHIVPEEEGEEELKLGPRFSASFGRRVTALKLSVSLEIEFSVAS